MDAASIVTFVIRVALAGTLAVAATAKFADRAGTRSATLALGVPKWAARWVAAALPIVEAALAVGLVVTSTAPVAAVGAAALLVLLAGVVAANLAMDRRPSCHCFGASDHQIGWGTVARNAILTGLAAVVVWRSTRPGGPCVVGCVSDATAAQGWIAAAVVVGAVVVALNAWVLVNLVRQNGRLAERISMLEGMRPRSAEPAVVGLPPGSAAVDFVLDRLDESTASLSGILTDGRAAILLFVEPGCDACVDLGRWIAAMPTSRPTAPHLVLIARGAAAHVAEAFGTPEHAELLVDPYGQIHAAYGVAATPSAVLVAAAGTIASRTAQGRRAVEDLVDRHHNETRFRPDAATATTVPNGAHR